MAPLRAVRVPDVPRHHDVGVAEHEGKDVQTPAGGTAQHLPLVLPDLVAEIGAECVGHGALVAFSWRVFHPRDTWAGALAGTLAALIGVALSGEVLSGEYLRYSDMRPISGPWLLFGLAARGAAPTWMAFECFRFHHKLRLRAKIGLAEPLVVNRVLLWGIAIGCSALGFGMSIVHRLVYGTGLRAHVWALTTVSALATVSALCLGLAFFPPKAYRRWLEERPGPAPRA